MDDDWKGEITDDGEDTGGQPTTLPGRPRAMEHVGGPLPERIGEYRILGLLGEGGMGVVYAAESGSLRREVALKVLRSAVHSREARLRFEAEGRALARMSHPSIAQVFEAGATAEGNLFLAMERIDGDRITTACDRLAVPLERRLLLFLEVCAGVHHAHQKGIIHRDIKPGNVLLSEGSGATLGPKLIDFGIAKAVDEPLTSATLVTGERVVGTPGYLSPEAADPIAENGDLDTRADVYALGALLHELVTGEPPFRLEHGQQSLLQLLVRVRTEDPPRPSERVRRLGSEAATVARCRGTSPADLVRSVAGDLDWIILKALARDRNQRYGSVAELAADVERHLAFEPVSARPPSTTYRVSRFVRRHRWLAVATAVAVLSLVGGITSTTLQARRASHEAARANREAEVARQVRSFLTGLFEESHPHRALGREVSAREVLERGARRIRHELGEQPEVRAEILLAIGEVFVQLGDFDEAEPLLEESVALRARGDSPLDLARSRVSLAILRRNQGRFDDAAELLGQALAVRREVLGEEHPEVASALDHLGTVYREQGRYAEAEETLVAAHAMAQAAARREGRDATLGLNGLGLVHWSQGDFARADEVLGRCLEVQEAELGPDHPGLATTLNNLALVAKALGDYERAVTLYRRDLEIATRVLGDGHPSVAMTMNNLANALRRLDRLDEAEALVVRALAIREATLGPDHPQVANSVNDLATLRYRQGRLDEVAKLYERALSIRRRALGDRHPDVAKAMCNLAQFHAEEGRPATAEPLYREAAEVFEAALGSDHLFLATPLHGLANIARDEGRVAEARELYARCVAILDRVLPADHPERRRLDEDLAALGP